MRVHYEYAAALNGATPRKTTFLGREFLVVPARLVRSQVLRNNLGASFLPPEEMTDEWAGVWNGIPVLIGEHPSVRGQAVSGRQPDLWNTRGAGWIFNASIATEEGGVRALRGEVWIDLARAPAVVGLQAVIDRVMTGNRVELSTGFPANIENVAGVFNGDAYELVMRPAGADHLVISTEFTGACSVAHGCGLGVNKQEPGMEQPKAEIQGAGGTKETPTPEATNGDARGKLRGIFNRALDFLAGREDKQRVWFEENASMNLARDFEALNSAPTSDQDRAARLSDALQTKFGNSDKRVYVTDVYGSQKQVVFWFSTPFGPMPEGSEYFRVDFTESDSVITFSEPVRVRRVTVYEEVPAAGAAAINAAPTKTTNCGCSQEAPMEAGEKKDLVNEIAAAVNAGLATTIAPLAEKITAANTAAEAATAKGVENATAIAALTAQVGTLAGVVNAERDAERQGLVVELSANSRTPFSAAELEAKPLDELRKLAQMAQVPVASYSGRGGPRSAANATKEEPFADTRPYFAKTTTNAEVK